MGSRPNEPMVARDLRPQSKPGTQAHLEVAQILFVETPSLLELGYHGLGLRFITGKQGPFEVAADRPDGG